MLNLYFRLKPISAFRFHKNTVFAADGEHRHIVFLYNVVIKWVENIIFVSGITIIGYGE